MVMRNVKLRAASWSVGHVERTDEMERMGSRDSPAHSMGTAGRETGSPICLHVIALLRQARTFSCSVGALPELKPTRM